MNVKNKRKLKPKTKKRLQLALAFACTISFTYGVTKELVVTDNSDTIMRIDNKPYTLRDFYMNSKKSSDSQELLISFLVMEAIQANYERLVTTETIDEQLAEVKSQFDNDEDFATFLSNNRINETMLKTNIKQQLVLDAALLSVVDISDDEINGVWENYHATTNIDIALFDEKVDAENFTETIGTSFDKAIKQSNATNQDEYKISFDTLDTAVLTTIKDAAWTLDDGEISQPIAVTNNETNKNQYYVIQKKSEQDKGDLDDHRKKIIQAIKGEKLQDADIASNAVADILKNAKIQAVDPDLDALILRYSNQTIAQKQGE